MTTVIRLLKKILPKSVFSFLQPAYHLSLAYIGAVIYQFPSKQIRVIAITGTKGKSSTAEFLNSILETAKHKTALASTIRFKIGNYSQNNLFRMTMPGRFFLQKFLRNAVDNNCDTAIIEMTSEGARQFRHRFIDLDCLIFLNLSPEHIESHGSYEKYVEAKLSIAKSLQNSNKPQRVLVANKDDAESSKFLNLQIPTKLPFGLNDASPHEALINGSFFTYQNRKIHLNFPGTFSIYNAYAAAVCASAFGISVDNIVSGLTSLTKIRGRTETIDAEGFKIVVDYAHTANSLEALYTAYPNTTKICVLGNTGGGRDRWKRPEMAKLAEKYCDEIILTNEDPYDEDPNQIIRDMSDAITIKRPKIIMDRREAISESIKIARNISDQNSLDTYVLITGKGTDPCIMGPRGSKTPWDDATVVREELSKI